MVMVRNWIVEVGIEKDGGRLKKHNRLKSSNSGNTLSNGAIGAKRN
jgi:hypothetical protein